MVERIVGVSSHHIRVVGLKFIVLRIHRKMEVLVKVFLEFMQQWIIGKKITKNSLLIWKVIFVIKLFPF